MLRRLKSDVEKNLPSKEETVIEVELTVLQVLGIFSIGNVHVEMLLAAAHIPSNSGEEFRPFAKRRKKECTAEPHECDDGASQML